MTDQWQPCWVDPGLLSASCMLVEGDDASLPWLRPGVHLRVFPSPHIGFPLCPFTVWSAGSATRSRTAINGRTACFSGSGEQALYVGSWGESGGPLSVLDAAGRTSGRCTRPVPFVARTPLTGLRYDGDAASPSFHPAVYEAGWRVDDDGRPVIPPWLPQGDALSAEEVPALDALGSQVPEGSWWCGADARFTSAELAHRMSGVPDDALPYDALQPADVFGRAQAQAIGLKRPVAKAWGAPSSGSPPVSASFPVKLPGTAPGSKDAAASVGLNVALWAACVDPAAARWWGFATTLPTEAYVDEGSASCFAVAALFAFPNTSSEPGKSWVGRARGTTSDPMAAPLAQALYAVHRSRDLEGLVQELRSAGHHVGCLWTIAVAAPPPDAPDPPTVTIPTGWSRWNAESSWTAVLSVEGAGGGPLAARREPDTPLNPYVRPGQLWRQPIVAPRAGPGSTAVALTDHRCPPEAARWSVRTADMWGQWSPHVSPFEADPPDPPAMPHPTVTLALTPADPAPVGTGPQSAGAVAIHVTLPQPTAAAPQISTVTANLAQATPSSVPLTLDTEGAWTGSASVVATTPGQTVTVDCAVEAKDATGRTADTTASLEVCDPRAFPARSSCHVMLFTGERRPDGFAELDVTAPLPSGVPPGLSWRLYIADEQVLAPGPTATESRWSRAARLLAQFNGAPDRSRMAQLTQAQVTAGANTLRVRCRLPGRLEQVQVLQLVPTTAKGLEAPAAECGYFTVAVPLGDTPPAPTLVAESGTADGKVSLTVSASYPGTRPLTTDPADAPPPEPILRRGTTEKRLKARIRRSALDTPPASWPVVAHMMLQPDNGVDPTTGWRWTGPVGDVLTTAIPAWTPLSYVCEVAWPDEPAWDPAAEPIQETTYATWAQPPAAQPSAWSPPSAVLTVLAPRPAPSIEPTYTDDGDGSATLSVPVPVAHPRANPWRLTAATPTQPSPTSVEGHGPELRLTGLDATVAAADWRLALTAPDGTLLPMVTGAGTPA
ncbi:hypothetical protein ACFVYD_04405 [Streptomyces sp. NPDC058301]|uniref:hypothetical protein n=1 Tax=Streptomyces sp. NPDC058301 TaxID=3346436 RepID=UPI0036E77C39